MGLSTSKVINFTSIWFNLLENGFEHSIFGWFRITDTMDKAKNYNLLRYRLYPNPKEKVDPIFEKLIRLNYDFIPGGKDNLVLEVANGKNKSKQVVITSFQS